MNWMRWMIKAKRWAQNPPSMRQVALYGGIIAACLVIAGIERFVGWPDWLTVNSMRAVP